MNINFKEYYHLITGISFESLGCLFSFRERVEMAYEKLKMEGFDII